MPSWKKFRRNKQMIKEQKSRQVVLSKENQPPAQEVTPDLPSIVPISVHPVTKVPLGEDRKIELLSPTQSPNRKSKAKGNNRSPQARKARRLNFNKRKQVHPITAEELEAQEKQKQQGQKQKQPFAILDAVYEDGDDKNQFLVIEKLKGVGENGCQPHKSKQTSIQKQSEPQKSKPISIQHQPDTQTQKVKPPKKGSTTEEVLSVLFFPDKSLPCSSFASGRCSIEDCPFSHEPTNLGELLTYLQKATATLDICVFTITCNEVRSVLF